jgi:hypothetical protein
MDTDDSKIKITFFDNTQGWMNLEWEENKLELKNKNIDLTVPVDRRGLKVKDRFCRKDC